jgi:hypothetical protein
MNYQTFLQSAPDEQLQSILQSGEIPPEFVQQEIARRAKLRTASEGASMTPDQLGLGAASNGY